MRLEARRLWCVALKDPGDTIHTSAGSKDGDGDSDVQGKQTPFFRRRSAIGDVFAISRSGPCKPKRTGNQKFLAPF